MAKTGLFKNYYGVELAERLAGEIAAVHPPFDSAAFIQYVAERVAPLELKDRVATIAAGLREHLPPTYPTALDLLLAILGPELEEEEGMFDHGYHIMPLAHFVEVYGLEHFEPSMHAIYEITKRFSSEFAIRPYILEYKDRVLPILHTWSDDPNPHVRRLVSEGSRPRLPWAMQLKPFIADPTPTLALLDRLKNDPSAYVRKSVANHLNDITKDHPDLVVETLRGWNQQPTDAITWITKHALRTLIKKGDPAALDLLGYGPPRVALTRLDVEPNPFTVGGTLEINFTLQSESEQPQELLIDHVLHFVKANGSRSPKVFKLGTRTLEPHQSLDIEKKQPLKPVTTRRYYPGPHRVEIQVNGQILGGTEFDLEV